MTPKKRNPKAVAPAPAKSAGLEVRAESECAVTVNALESRTMVQFGNQPTGGVVKHDRADKISKAIKTHADEINNKATKTHHNGVDQIKKATKTHNNGANETTKTHHKGVDEIKKTTKTHYNGVDQSKKATKTHHDGVEIKRATKTLHDGVDEVKTARKVTEERWKEMEACATLLLQQQTSDGNVTEMKGDALQAEELKPRSHAANKLIERRKMVELRKFMAFSEKQASVESYWNSMSDNEKQGFFKVSIPEMKAHYKKNSLAFDVISEALAYVQSNKVWTFFECGQCKEKFVDCEAFMDHVVVEHVDHDWAKHEEVLPQEASNDWVEMVFGSDWHPLDASASMDRFMNGQSCDGSDDGREDSSECLDSKGSSNPCHFSLQQANVHRYQALPVDDPERSKLLRRIQGRLRVLIKHKYFTSRHVEKMMDFAMDVLPELTRMSLNCGKRKALLQNPSFMCFLGSQDLKIILRKLELIAVKCELGKSPEEDNTPDATGQEGTTVQDRNKIFDHHVLSCDSSSIFLDSRFLPAMLGLTTSVDLPEQSEPEAGVLVRWLFSAPTGEEHVLSWTSLREEKARGFMQIIKSLQIEHYQLLYWCEKKIQWSSYEADLWAIQNLFLQEICSSDLAQSVPQSCKTILEKSPEELGEEDDMSTIRSRIELDVICVVLQNARAICASQHRVHDTSSADLESCEENDYRTQEYLHQLDDIVKAAIVKKMARADIELDMTDAKIMKCLADMQLLKSKINSVSAMSYQMVVAPLVKSFLRIYLEDLAEKAAKEKSDAASRAILEEFDDDSSRNVNKGGGQSNKSKAKSRKKKDKNTAK